MTDDDRNVPRIGDIAAMTFVRERHMTTEVLDEESRPFLIVHIALVRLSLVLTFLAGLAVGVAVGASM